MTLTAEQKGSLRKAADKAKHAGEEPVMHFDARIAALNEFQLAACPANVLALLDELEELQQQKNKWADWAEQLGQMADGIDKRIAELEARTLTVNLRKHSTGEVMVITGFDEQYAEGWCSANDWAIQQIREACAAAGITVKVGE